MQRLTIELQKSEQVTFNIVHFVTLDLTSSLCAGGSEAGDEAEPGEGAALSGDCAEEEG